MYCNAPYFGPESKEAQKVFERLIKTFKSYNDTLTLRATDLSLRAIEGDQYRMLVAYHKHGLKSPEFRQAAVELANSLKDTLMFEAAAIATNEAHGQKEPQE